jgi:hypothetical protein
MQNLTEAATDQEQRNKFYLNHIRDCNLQLDIKLPTSSTTTTSATTPQKKQIHKLLLLQNMLL